MLDFFTFIVLIVSVAAGVWLAVKLGGLPGKIARERQHPQAEAINVCGWLGLITLGLAWPIALVWAFTKPVKTNITEHPAADMSPTESPAGFSDIEHRLDGLEKELRRLADRREGEPS